MKKEYFSPEWEVVVFNFQGCVLTGSVENESSVIGGNDDFGDEIEFG